MVLLCRLDDCGLSQIHDTLGFSGFWNAGKSVEIANLHYGVIRHVRDCQYYLLPQWYVHRVVAVLTHSRLVAVIVAVDMLFRYVQAACMGWLSMALQQRPRYI